MMDGYDIISQHVYNFYANLFQIEMCTHNSRIFNSLKDVKKAKILLKKNVMKTIY